MFFFNLNLAVFVYVLSSLLNYNLHFEFSLLTKKSIEQI